MLRSRRLLQYVFLVSSAKAVQIDHEPKLVPVGPSSLLSLYVIIHAIVICFELADEYLIALALVKLFLPTTLRLIIVLQLLLQDPPLQSSMSVYDLSGIVSGYDFGLQEVCLIYLLIVVLLKHRKHCNSALAF